MSVPQVLVLLSACIFFHAEAQISEDLRGLSPKMVQVVGEIHPDSLLATMEHLESYGSRFKLLENRRQIAIWLKGRFETFGITDVVLDSFFCHVHLPYDTTLWQYNVIARITGSSAPDEVSILGAHYDSYSNAMYTLAPGADDNASGVAAILEIARVMKRFRYQPETTISFALFAAEEMGGQGSEYIAAKARETGMDIRYMVNLDMIANNPNNQPGVKIYQFQDVRAAGELASSVFQDSTKLNPVIPDDSTNNESDSYFFWLNGFPTTFLIESDFSPHWHTTHDTTGACNMEYCAEITSGVLATLLKDQQIPYPRSFSARSTKEFITLSWNKTGNSHVKGYNLYRSITNEGNFVRVNQNLIHDSCYIDIPPLKGRVYFYCLKTVDHSMNESTRSDLARGIVIDFCDTLLVINAIPNNSSVSTEIRGFYNYLLDSIPHQWYDINQQHTLSLQEFLTHQNIWWIANSFNLIPELRPAYHEFEAFFQNEGNMLITAFLPASLFDGETNNAADLSPGTILHDFFLVDSLLKKPTSLMYRANPDEEGFRLLNVDSAKEIVQGLPGELQNIESYVPRESGKVIYRFDSHFSPTSPPGALQDHPVGLEYIGDDFRTILLSFPLFYIDSADAKSFIQYVWKEKFTHTSYIFDPIYPENEIRVNLAPNPASGFVSVTFSLEKPSSVMISVITTAGLKEIEMYKDSLPIGKHTLNLNIRSLKPGVYVVVVNGTEWKGFAKLTVTR